MMMENAPLIDNLVTPDPFILPAVYVLSSFLNIEIGAAKRLIAPDGTEVKRTKFQVAIPWVLRGVTVAIGVFALYMPSVSCQCSFSKVIKISA